MLAGAGRWPTAPTCPITPRREGLIKTAISEFGRLDVLVNAAGILRDRMIFNMTEPEWDDVIRVHLKGTFNTTKFAAAHWRAQHDESAQNRIINFTSVSGLHGSPGQPNYAAAKMGIVGLTYSAANSLAKYGVTVNAVSPGAATRMTESVPDGRRRARAETAGERSPDNVAPLVAYLASERSGWITGRIVHTAGYEVALYDNPHPVIRVVGAGPWSLDALARQVERSFGPATRAGRDHDRQAGAGADAGDAALLGRLRGGRAAHPALPGLRDALLLPASRLPGVRLGQRRVVHGQRAGDAVLLRDQPPARRGASRTTARTPSPWCSWPKGPG